MVRTAVFEIAANSFEIWLGRERPFKRRWGEEMELLVGIPQQGFSHLHISQNRVEGLLKQISGPTAEISDSVGQRWGLRIYILVSF